HDAVTLYGGPSTGVACARMSASTRRRICASALARTPGSRTGTVAEALSDSFLPPELHPAAAATPTSSAMPAHSVELCLISAAAGDPPPRPARARPPRPAPRRCAAWRRRSGAATRGGGRRRLAARAPARRPELARPRAQAPAAPPPARSRRAAPPPPPARRAC